MSLPTVVRESAPGAEDAPEASVAACDIADPSISDTFSARTFSRQLGAARRTALTEPAAVAHVLSEWISKNG